MFTSRNPLLQEPPTFDRYCDNILSSFSKKWYPQSIRLEYIHTFSISRWKELPDGAKENHSLSYCNACYKAYPSLQREAQPVCLRSMNAESQERLFSQAKHISLKATSRKPENVLPKILICMQARQMAGDCQQSIHKQESMVSVAASKLDPYGGTYITEVFISGRLSSWQAHLTRISGYMKHGEEYGGKGKKMDIHLMMVQMTLTFTQLVHS